MTDATNKIAVVTGAGTGVGRAASLALMLAISCASEGVTTAASVWTRNAA